MNFAFHYCFMSSREIQLISLIGRHVRRISYKNIAISSLRFSHWQVLTMCGTIDSILFCFCLWFAIALQGNRADVNSSEDSPVVQTALGEIRGRVLRSRLGNRFYAFRGVRYAQAPIGSLRFKVRAVHHDFFPNVFTHTHFSLPGRLKLGTERSMLLPMVQCVRNGRSISPPWMKIVYD